MTDLIDITKTKRKLKIGAIIQARMTSKRFPGKSMAVLRGAPVLEHVIRNIKRVPQLNEIIVAVPDTPESEPMLKLIDRMGVKNFCGSEDNVLDRYYEAAKFFKLDIVMRITGDCPFINPVICAEVLDLLLSRKLDYCTNSYPKRTYPKGLDCEVFTFDCLEVAHNLATDPYDLEHVTPWMQKTQGIRRANVVQEIDASHINVCIDEPADILRLEVINLSVKQ